MPMRKLLAVVVLLCGAVGADAAEPHKWCSDGFDGGRAELVSSGNGLALTIGGEPVEIEGDGHEPTVGSAMLTFSDGGKPTHQIWIFRDRVFWPCP